MSNRGGQDKQQLTEVKKMVKNLFEKNERGFKNLFDSLKKYKEKKLSILDLSKVLNTIFEVRFAISGHLVSLFGFQVSDSET